MKKLLPIIIIILCVSLVYGVAPVTQIQIYVGETGIEIEYPKITTLQLNRDFKFHFHLFNSSNGMPILNESTSCVFHLYNSTGSHIYTENDIKELHDDYDFEVKVNGGNFSKVGPFEYRFQCNSSTSNIGGFVSVPVTVTKDGYDNILDIGMYIGLIIFSAIFMVGGALLFFMKRKEGEE